MTYDVDYEYFVGKFVPNFLYDYDFDLNEDGDFLVIDTNEQESYFNLIARKGQYYYDIKIGIGIYNYINSNVNKAELKKIIKSGLVYDGFKVNKINILTLEDLENLGINESDLINLLNKNHFVIDMEIER